MRRWVMARMVFLSALGVLAYPTAVCAQLPPRLKRCLPFPTFADEVNKMQEAIDQNAEPQRPQRRVRVDAVTVEGAPDLQETIKRHISEWFKRNENVLDSADESDCLNAAREYVRDELRDRGYFSADAVWQVSVLSQDPGEDHVAVTFHVKEGPQYRLKEIQFAGAHIFPPWYLRKEFPLQDGAIFDLSKIRKGIEALTSLYGSQGYINFTAEPDIRFDNAHHLLSMRLDLGEGQQFRVGSVKVLGPARLTSGNVLKMPLKPGEIFNPEMVRDFFEENKAVLPADVSPREDTRISQDTLHATVGIVFDVRGCP